MLQSLMGLKRVKNAGKRSENATAKNENEYDQARREERAKGSKLCEECGHRIKNESWEAHFHYALHPNSELNVLLKGYLKQLGDLRRQGKLNDKIQSRN